MYLNKVVENRQTLKFKQHIGKNHIFIRICKNSRQNNPFEIVLILRKM